MADNFEFIELYNRSDQAIDLSNWRLTGAVEFTLPAGTMIQAGQTLTLVGFDSTNTRQADIFRFTLGMPDSAALLGPFEPPLDDLTGHVQLVRPAELPAGTPDPAPYLTVDSARYQSSSPWPATAAGTGHSLARVWPDESGQLPISWIAAAPSPGVTAFAGPRLPGDANGDGQMDPLDIVQVLQAGKYLADEAATWGEGDWTGDGRFDPRDIVWALQKGDGSRFA